MTEELILEEGAGEVRTLVLNRPGKLNCINWSMMEALDGLLSRLEADSQLRLLFLRGAGERAFCTGGDLNEFRELDRDASIRWIRFGSRLFERLERLSAVTVALLHGYVFGGGLELALACDLRAAAPDTVLASPEMGHGWAPGWGALDRLPRMVGESRAKQIIFFGERISAQEALRVGLVNWMLEESELQDHVQRLSEQARSWDPALVGFIKTVLRAGTSPDQDVLATLVARNRR